VKRDTSNEGRDQYDALASALASRGQTVAGQMFGMPVLKVRGKAFAGYYDGGMTFKLAEPRRSEGLALQGAQLLDPSGMGRPMREWVQVPAACSAQWAELAEAALAYVGGADR
jgi:hypothetical protein